MIPHLGSFPTTRLRRLRATSWSRGLAQDVHVVPGDLIWPIFIRDATTDPLIPSMAGVTRYTLDELASVVHHAQTLGIGALGLFPCPSPAVKCPQGAEAWSSTSLIVQAIALLNQYRDHDRLGLIADVALDPYTTHGHDGILDPAGHVDNDATLDALSRQACVLAQAGVDIIAPSDMMDGRVGTLRQALDAAGFSHVGIMAYGAKFNSAFYGPFRDAVGSSGALKKGSKLGYQLHPGSADEALREVALDLAEGADAIIIKPGMAYLDIIQRTASVFPAPIFAFQVSGEYSMIQLAAQHLGMDKDAMILESLTAFKRAGCRGVWTYFAPEAAALLGRGIKG